MRTEYHVRSCQELNLSNDDTLDFVVVRCDDERIVVDLDIEAPPATS
jgi:hypothetical protein